MLLFSIKKFCTRKKRGTRRNKNIWNKDQPPDPTSALTTCLMPGSPQQTATSPTGRWKVCVCALTAGMHRWSIRVLSHRSMQSQMRGPVQPLQVWKMCCAWLGAGPCMPHVLNTLTPHGPAFCPGSCRTGPAAEGKHISAPEKCKRAHFNVVHEEEEKGSVEGGAAAEAARIPGNGVFVEAATCADHVSPTAVG